MKNFIKKSLTACIVFVLVTLAASSVYAYAQTPNIRINNELVDVSDYTKPPVIINRRTFVSLDWAIENLGFLLEWREESQTAILARPENTVMLRVGMYSMTSMGDYVSTDIAVQIINGQVMIPLRVVSEATGLPVRWCTDSFTVEITGYIPIREPVPTIQREADGFSIDMTPDEFEEILIERGITPRRRLNDIDHLGGHSFSYNPGDMWVRFDSSHTLESV